MSRILVSFVHYLSDVVDCRTVRNDRVARPLAKGILDGTLISAFEDLPIPRQEEMTRQIATERSAVLKDWLSLGAAW